MKRLLQGIAGFQANQRAHYRKALARLAHGQEPRVLAIVCSDSRISPVEFASSQPGDVFVVRVVGNLVPPYLADAAEAPAVGAALEYALAVLPVEDVIVCGHSGCGAIHAMSGGKVPRGTPHLAAWLALGRRSLANVPPAPAGTTPADHLSRQNVLRQVENLRTYPAVRAGERAGRVRLHAWWFDVGRADLFEHDEATGEFVRLDEQRIAAHLAQRAGKRQRGSAGAARRPRAASRARGSDRR